MIASAAIAIIIYVKSQPGIKPFILFCNVTCEWQACVMSHGYYMTEGMTVLFSVWVDAVNRHKAKNSCDFLISARTTKYEN